MSKENKYRGRVIRTLGGYYTVYPQGDGEIVQAFIRGRLKKEGQRILVGDEVVYSFINEEQVIIEEILPRTSYLERPLMANVDRVIVTFSLQQPAINYNLLDRYLILVEDADLQVVICINKLDLEEDLSSLTRIQHYPTMGYTTVFCSAHTGEGIRDLKGALSHGVNVFAGPSGVGKSAILNALHPDLHLKTGEISSKLKRGRHTTRLAQLFILEEDTYVADTPGFSSLKVLDIEVSHLQYYFPDFKPFIGECFFHSCIHDAEPKCGVKKALAEDRILQSRYETYISLLQELKGKDR